MTRLPTVPTTTALDLARRQLERSLRLEREYGDQLNDYGHRLVRRAAFASYLEMRDAGLTAEADLILRQGSVS